MKEYDVAFVGLLKMKLSIVDRKDVNSLIGVDWNFCHFPWVV